MSALGFFHRLNRIAGNAAMAIASLLLVYMVLHISLEIVLRALFGTSTYSMDEYVGYAVGAMTFLALAHTFRSGQHIRVGLLTSRLRGRAAVAVEALCILFTFGIGVFLARFVWRMLARDFSRGSVSSTLNETPLWFIDAAIFVGLVLFLIQLVASLVETLRTGVVLDAPEGH